MTSHLPTAPGRLQTPGSKAPPWVDATDLAARIRRGELTPLDAVDLAIARIESGNPRLNSVIVELFDQARREAAQPRRPNAPFDGVPIVLKDLGAVQRGQPYHGGNRALRDAGYRAREDSVLGRRFRDLGFLTVGTTNSAEMGAQTTTQPLAFGPTRNPWDLRRSPAGSSGGSAAAVAAGLVPISHGNDGLGSIRLPAAWCGLVGFKPSRGRVPVGVRSISRMNHEFVLTRSVRDATAVLDGVQGTDGELFTMDRMKPLPRHPLVEEQTSLRVGLCWQAPDGGPVEPRYAEAVREVGHALQALGHQVDLAHPAALFDDQSESLAPDRPSEYRRRLRAIGQLLGRPVNEDDVEPYLWAMAHRHHHETVDAHVAASEWEQAWAGRVLAWWHSYDLLVTPTVPFGPQLLDDLRPPADDPTRFFDQMRRHISFSAPFNVTGQPALALPWLGGRRTDAVPPSVQLVGGPGRDAAVLSVAAHLESLGPALPWPSGT